MPAKSAYAGQLSVGTASVELLEARSIRRDYVIISNEHATNVVYVALGVAAVAGNGITVQPKTSVRVDEFNGAINIISSGSSTTVGFEETFLDRVTPGEVESSSSSTSSASSSSNSSSSSSNSSSSRSSASSNSSSSNSSSSSSP